MRVPYMKSIDFEIFVAEFIEDLKPETMDDIQDIAEDLHNALEIGIKDYIESEEDRFNYDDYDPLF